MAELSLPLKPSAQGSNVCTPEKEKRDTEKRREEREGDEIMKGMREK